METLNMVAANLFLPTLIVITAGIVIGILVFWVSKDGILGFIFAGTLTVMALAWIFSITDIKNSASFTGSESGMPSEIAPQFIEHYYDIDFSDNQLNELALFQTVTVDGVQYQLVEYNENKYVLADVSRNIEYTEQVNQEK